MTLLYRADPYRREAPGRVSALTPEGGVVLDASLFFPKSGGQPGDSGWIDWDGRRLEIATALVSEDGRPVLVPAAPEALPGHGCHITQVLDWERRHRNMRVHTALHLLMVVIPLPVAASVITAGQGMLDFEMPHLPAEPIALEKALNDLVDKDLEVQDSWISAEELRTRPDLQKGSDKRGLRSTGDMRLVHIGKPGREVNIQLCDGTHVARTGEIGALRLDKFETREDGIIRVTVQLDN